MLGKIGVKVSLFAQTKSKHFKELKDNQGDFYMLGWGVPTLDSHYVFHYLYESGASWNRVNFSNCLLYTSPSPRDRVRSRMPSSA